MWVIMNERYIKEKEQYHLREACENCRHYCEERNKCAMLYPVEQHRKDTFLPREIGARIYFCKMFETDDA